MKWPMPREAKFSPVFQEVRPEIVPLHSFCQILWPMRRESVEDKAALVSTDMNVAVRANRTNEHRLISGLGLQRMNPRLATGSRCHIRDCRSSPRLSGSF